MRQPVARLLRVFATGALVALPLAATVALCFWAVSLVIRWIGPTSPIGAALSRIGLGVTGSELVGYAVGIAIVLASIFALGVLAEAGLQQGLNRAVRAIVTRIPLVGALYDILHKMVGLFSQRDAEGLKSMSAVWCHFGGPPEGAAPGGGRVGAIAWRQLACILGANVVFGALLAGVPALGIPAFGLVVAIFALVPIASLAGGKLVWKEVLILATVLATGSYLTFIKLLSLQFPAWPSFITG